MRVEEAVRLAIIEMEGQSSPDEARRALVAAQRAGITYTDFLRVHLLLSPATGNPWLLANCLDNGEQSDERAAS